MRTVHNSLYETLLHVAPLLVNYPWINNGYNPHATSIGKNIFATGSYYNATGLYMVEKIKTTDGKEYKVVRKKFTRSS